MDIENLKRIKIGDNVIIDSDLKQLIEIYTMGLEEIKRKSEVDKSPEKWQPLDEGYYYFYTDRTYPFKLENLQSHAHIADMGLVCKTEKDAEEKHKKLRAFCRLDSVVREYGDYEFKKDGYNYFPIPDKEWYVGSTENYSPIGIYHTKEVIKDVCRRLNSGEVEL